MDVHNDSIAISIAPSDSTEVRRWASSAARMGTWSGSSNSRRPILWHLLKFKEAFDWKVFVKEEEKMKRKKLARLQNLAAAMNYQLTPLS